MWIALFHFPERKETTVMKYYAVDPYSECKHCGSQRVKNHQKAICPSCGQVIPPQSDPEATRCQKCDQNLEKILIGEKTDENHESEEPVNKNMLLFLIRHWPRQKDTITGRRYRTVLSTFDLKGNSIPHDSKSARAWVMVNRRQIANKTHLSSSGVDFANDE